MWVWFLVLWNSKTETPVGCVGRMAWWSQRYPFLPPSLHMQCVFVAVSHNTRFASIPFTPSPPVKVQQLERKEVTPKCQPLGYGSCHPPLGGLLCLSFPSWRIKQHKSLRLHPRCGSKSQGSIHPGVVRVLSHLRNFRSFSQLCASAAQGTFLEERCLWHSRSMGTDPSPCSQGSIWCWSTTLGLALPTPFRSGIN